MSISSRRLSISIAESPIARYAAAYESNSANCSRRMATVSFCAASSPPESRAERMRLLYSSSFALNVSCIRRAKSISIPSASFAISAANFSNSPAIFTFPLAICSRTPSIQASNSARQFGKSGASTSGVAVTFWGEFLFSSSGVRVVYSFSASVERRALAASSDSTNRLMSPSNSS